MSQAQICVDARARLCECPLWRERDQRLYWIDIDAATLSCWQATDRAERTWALPARVGSFALCERPGLLLRGLATSRCSTWIASGSGPSPRSSAT